MLIRTAAIAAALLSLGGPICAQQVGVAAEVPVASPTGAGTRNLLFGTIVSGGGSPIQVDVPAAVAPGAGGTQSGEFRYNVAGTRGIDFRVTMPTQLVRPGSPPLTLTSNGNQYGGWCVSSAATCALNAFNPAASSNVRVCRSMFLIWCNPFAAFPSGSLLRVYVGGRLTVPPTAVAGVYTGTVTLTIVQVF